MRERIGQILKIACLVLAALLFYQLVQTTFRINPLARVTIPALPTLDSETNAPTAVSGKGTNSASPLAKGTNSSAGISGTNAGAAKAMKEKDTNILAAVSTNLIATNIPGPLAPIVKATDLTNSTAQVSQRKTENLESNLPALTATATNPASVLPGVSETNIVLSAGVEATNAASRSSPKETNVLFSTTTNGTNLVVSKLNDGTNVATSKTNFTSRSKSKDTNSPPSGAMAMSGMNPAMMRGGGKPAELPPEIKARVDRIYESELFGMVVRPQPMALQGIAGNSAFLRSPSGQTGLVKEGDSLGEIKLLKIGINRVLVEQDGKKSELTIFDGYGSESLMPKDKETSKEKEISK